MIRMIYTGTRPLKLINKDKTHILNYGDVVSLEPWKWGPRISLFKVHEDEDITSMPNEVKKKLEPLRKRGIIKWEDPPAPTEEELIAIVADLKEISERGEIV